MFEEEVMAAAPAHDSGPASNAHRVAESGFTLTELAVVLVIVALLIGGLMMPLGAQDDLRRTRETQKTLDDALDALIGFAATNGRLPCPATAASNGQESFAAGGNASNGNCSNFYDGFLPAAALGIAPIDSNGLAVDAWGQPIRYAVYGQTIGGHLFTEGSGMKSATLSNLANANAIYICASATGIAASNCGTAFQLTNSAPALLFSLGRSGAAGATADDAANLDGNSVFVSASPSGANTGDDIVVWLSPNTLYNRMIAAGQLP